ncbi:Carboxyvinyl-carboxyphosphonate phosphorylmutase [Sulfitobacter noctilucicola]|uniref:Methylisocitrate lyase n=1 Tax=Sulfitobacter noctilucicola TaxID=1342301 RepID=A0A7W6M9T7_9RHOB|nr:isocitrate lyase/PEP mutase family protein [Sulfitobacter noctilucicola]KIN63387.1 Carboxyvinyl-carboxyphosphonate phosphorylmutase [Sulfitobacter noctilucicola]MBB4175095.1 methylisocitrate lyase [Sulfitobacter noctilucicola]
MISQQQKKDFAAALRAGEMQIAPGCFDAMSAMLAVKGGAQAVMTSGFAVSASHLGFPDVELYTMTENLNVVRNIANAVDVPVVADTDTGYGNAMNVMRTVREFEQAGVCAMIFEDQVAPKRCAAAAKQLEIIPAYEHASKIRAAVQARRDPDTLIIARTDAMTQDEAIDRAKMYAEAGADLIQPISRTFTDFDGLKRMREAVGVPLSLQILGWLEKDLTQQQMAQVAGVACYPLVGLMSAAQAMQDNYAKLLSDKGTANLPHPVMSMADFKTFIGFEDIEQQQLQFMLTDLKS